MPFLLGFVCMHVLTCVCIEGVSYWVKVDPSEKENNPYLFFL